jgi:type II secretory pathway pseudopilin PulG
MPRAREHGAVLALVLAIIVMVMIGVAASYALSRLSGAKDDSGQIGGRLTAAVTALEQYAGSAQRLPCPANPAVDDGVELPVVPTGTCTHADGTIPWRTIGMRRDDAIDPWGRKLTYRVYTGNKGSLTQPGGINMVECDVDEPSAGAVSNATGLCIPNANPLLRNSSEARFLQGKGMSLDDNGVPRTVAYVIVSHGATGLGGITASGVRLMPLPPSNVGASGPFVVKPFSDVETKADANSHFDDYVAYRTIPDLVKRLGLQARPWPEADPTVTTALTLDAASIFAATGTTPTAATVLGTSIDFGNVVVTGYSASTANLSYDTTSPGAGTNGGLGVGGGTFTDGFSFLNNFITNYESEYLEISKLAAGARKFAITLNDEGLTEFNVRFRVRLRFYKDTTSGETTTTALVHTAEKDRCLNSSQLASYSIDVPAEFNRVEVHPVTSSYFAGLSAFLVADIKACTVAATACRTGLALAASPANSTDCP